MSCAADECGENLDAPPVFVLPPGSFAEVWKTLRDGRPAYLPYRSGDFPPMPIFVGVPLWSRPIPEKAAEC